MERLLSHPQPSSNYRRTPLTKALGFIHGLLCGAEKLTQMAHLRRDPLAAELLGVPRLPSRREGYSLDLDSTRLLHEDGQHEGMRAGYTRAGIKPCLHPLLAVLEEA